MALSLPFKASSHACRFRRTLVGSGTNSLSTNGLGSDRQSTINYSSRRSIARLNAEWNGCSRDAEILLLVRPCMCSPVPFSGCRYRSELQLRCTHYFLRTQRPCPLGCNSCIHSQPLSQRASSWSYPYTLQLVRRQRST